MRWAVFALVLLSYAFFAQGGSANVNSRFDLTRAIVEQRTLSIDAYHANTFDKSYRDGRYYSDKAPGLSLAAALPYALVSRVEERWALHLTTVGSVGVVSALGAVALHEVLLSLGVSALVALISVAAWAFGTNGFAYGTLFMAHQWCGALLILSFAALRRGSLALAGFCAAWAAISEYPVALPALALFAYGLKEHGRRIGPFVLAALAPLAVLAVYNTLCFGAPYRLGYTQLASAYFGQQFGFELPRPSTAWALLFGEYRGLLPLSPFLLLFPFGLARMPRREAYLCGAIVLSMFLVGASYRMWHGGAAMGPRYLVPMLPFAVVGAAFVTVRLFAPLVAVSIAVCTACVAVMPEFLDTDWVVSPLDFQTKIDMRKPLRAFVFPLFVRGKVGIKATSFGKLGWSRYEEHRDDAFNLGEKVGLRGLWSLTPLLALWAGFAVRFRASARGESAPRP